MKKLFVYIITTVCYLVIFGGLFYAMMKYILELTDEGMSPIEFYVWCSFFLCSFVVFDKLFKWVCKILEIKQHEL